MRLFRLLVAALLVAVMGILFLPLWAQAHESRDVGDKYRFVVGWTGEPAYVGQRNGVDLTVTTRDTAQPVEGLETTLKVELLFGGIKRETPLRAVFRQPGKYTADVIPTRDGDYRFRFFGTIENTPVDVTFDSADGKFNGVLTTTAIQFPAVEASAAQLNQAVQAAEQKAAQAQATASTGQAIGIASGALGLLGLALSAFALTRTRRVTRSS